jgi:hypothetical protein
MISLADLRRVILCCPASFKVPLAAIFLLSLALTSPPQSVSSSTQATSPAAASDQAQEMRKIAGQAYTFAYPLVVVEMTRRATTMGGDPKFLHRFRHEQAFPDDRFRQVIRPNADTLYSAAWFDLSKEPVLLHVPDTKGRYYIMQFMDAWSETLTSPGKRTTGTGEGWFALVGPGWKGQLPEHVKRIDCPTNTAWLIGRTQTNGPGDFDFVHAIQQSYKLAPLSTYPQGSSPLPIADLAQLPPGANVPPPAQVARMSATEFFQLFAQLLAKNPPHAEDASLVQRLATIGIVAGKPFPAVELTAEQRRAIAEGAEAAATALAGFDGSKQPTGTTGWSLPGKYGRYGTNYMVRALAARFFLGVLPPEDAVYLSCLKDSTGQPFQGAQRYSMHFEKGQVPPVKAFWSLTLYDNDGYFAANPLKRFAIGDRDALKFNGDGSLDLYIQHDSPGADRESNWLPAPPAGFGFNLALRMFWPDDQVVKGAWTPPPVVAASSKP